VEPSESQTDQFGFEHAIYAIIIFLFCISQSVKGTFRMEYDQRAIIKFLLNEEIRTGRRPLDVVDAKIRAILNESPFESARSIVETLQVVHSRLLLHLHDSIDFRSFDLYWVPLMSAYDLREKWMERAQAMLPVLYIAERDG
jgi:hypothetical protein